MFSIDVAVVGKVAVAATAFIVPPLTVTVPLLVMVVPTVNVLPLTVSVPPLLTVTVAAVAAAPLTVTLWVFNMVGLSVAVGTTPVTQVLVFSQGPLCADVNAKVGGGYAHV
ncbi:MAG: hypothetical protein M0D57_07270 [Sphingobacteriales bacterium JAD_PAG50586_3]|nr:MAG: hypothetical protein M0D57_07270 [Sphingobacteriales bacterium JAD_PAG50586_3]